jgi:hypothetical protein
MDSNDLPIFHVKISEVNKLLNKQGKFFVRLTGYLDGYDGLHKTGTLYSLENEYLAEERDILNVAFNSDYEKNLKRFEMKINFKSLENFNINDFNSRYDLIQIIGHLKASGNGTSELNAVFYRIIKRMELNKYYHAIDLQRYYLRAKGFLKDNDICMSNRKCQTN